MSKKNRLWLIAALAFVNFSLGQEIDSIRGIKRTGGSYANLFKFEFKPGKTDEGLDILKSTLIPAFNNAGVRITLIEDLMGQKDLIALIELKEGPSFYEYVLPKQDLMLLKELLKISGSEEETERRLDQFINLLVKQTQTLVYISEGY